MCLESIFVKMSQPVIKVCSWLTVCGHLSRYNPSGSPLVQNAWCCTPSRGGSSEDGRWSLHEALDLLWSGGRDSPPLYQSKYWTGLDLKETITRPKDKVQGVCVWEESTKKQIGKQNLTAKVQRWFYCVSVHLQQTPQWSWEGSGWVWELCPGLCACSRAWAATAACEPLPLPNAPQHQTNAPPSPLECPSPTLPPMYLREGGMKNQ